MIVKHDGVKVKIDERKFLVTHPNGYNHGISIWYKTPCGNRSHRGGAGWEIVNEICEDNKTNISKFGESHQFLVYESNVVLCER